MNTNKNKPVAMADRIHLVSNTPGRSTVVILLIVLLLMPALRSHAQSLNDYLKIAEENNPGLKAQYAEFEATMQKIPQVSSLSDPTVSVSALGQMIETRLGPQRAVFIINQMFPWFGTLKAQGNAAALMADAQFQNYLDKRNELFYKVKSAYYPLYELEEQIRLNRENLSILETYKTLSTSKFRNGQGTMVDVIRTDIMIKDLQTEIEILTDKEIPLETQFNKLLNRTPDAEIIIDDTLTVPAVESFVEDSLFNNNPKLLSLDKKISAAQAQQLAAKKQGMPKLGVGLNYTIIGKREDMDVADNGKDAIMPMVSVSIPIFRKKYKAAVKEAEFMETAYARQKEESENNLQSAFEMAVFNRDKALKEIELYEAQTEQTQRALNLLLTAYSNSGKDFEEILRMQQQLIKYKIARASALKDLYLAIANVDYLIIR